MYPEHSLSTELNTHSEGAGDVHKIHQTSYQTKIQSKVEVSVQTFCQYHSLLNFLLTIKFVICENIEITNK